MIGNPWQGEVALVINGKRQVMKLTLGALAALEAEMKQDSLVSLVERFETGAFATRDVVLLLEAGLRGGGWQGDIATVLDAEIEGGPLEATRKAALLLGRAFSFPERVA